MKVVPTWFKRYVAGALRSPQALVAAARREAASGASAADRVLTGAPPDGVKWDAPARLAAPSFFMSTAHLAQGERADWQGCDPRLMLWSAKFIEAARQRRVPLYVHCAYRGREEQLRLFAEGRSRVQFPNGAHNRGAAVDVVHGVFHWDMSPAEWRTLAQLGWRCLDQLNAGVPKADQLALTWGGEWQFYDPAHWEITGFRETRPFYSEGEPVRLMPRRILADSRI